MAWTNPRVPAFSQFLLVDAAPNPKYKKGSKPYWATFQSGLLFYPSGAAKPAYNAFELPLWLPKPQHGSHVLIWGQIRPPTPPRWRSCSSSPREPTRGPRWPRSARPTPRASSPPTSASPPPGACGWPGPRPAASRSTAAPLRSAERPAPRRPAACWRSGAERYGRSQRRAWEGRAGASPAKSRTHRSRTADPRRAISRFSRLNLRSHTAREGVCDLSVQDSRESRSDASARPSQAAVDVRRYPESRPGGETPETAASGDH